VISSCKCCQTYLLALPSSVCLMADQQMFGWLPKEGGVGAVEVLLLLLLLLPIKTVSQAHTFEQALVRSSCF